MSDDALFNDPRELNNMKRHSEGTFSNDYSKYLETRRAQDFVQWLMNSKRSGYEIDLNEEDKVTFKVYNFI